MNNRAIDYMVGGYRAGLPWKKSFISPKKVSFTKILAREFEFPDGSGNSSIIIVWLDFIAEYTFVDNEKLLLDWCNYLAEGIDVNELEGGLKKFVEFLFVEKNTKGLTLKQIIQNSQAEMADDNGCLLLVYCLHDYAQTAGIDSYQLVQRHCALSHSHPRALFACHFLLAIIERIEDRRDPRFLGEVCPSFNEPLSFIYNYRTNQTAFLKQHPGNLRADWAVSHALRSSFAGVLTQDEGVMVECVSLGGDVATVLSLAMLLHCLTTYPVSRKTVQDIFPEAPDLWKNWPATLGVRFQLLERMGFNAMSFHTYYAKDVTEAVKFIWLDDIFHLPSYQLSMVGAFPAMKWDYVNSLEKNPSFEEFRHRDKVQGARPWDMDADTSIMEFGVKMLVHDEEDLCEEEENYDDVPEPEKYYFLRTGGRTKAEAKANWESCARVLRGLKDKLDHC